MGRWISFYKRDEFIYSCYPHKNVILFAVVCELTGHFKHIADQTTFPPLPISHLAVQLEASIVEILDIIIEGVKCT